MWDGFSCITDHTSVSHSPWWWGRLQTAEQGDLQKLKKTHGNSFTSLSSHHGTTCSTGLCGVNLWNFLPLTLVVVFPRWDLCFSPQLLNLFYPSFFLSNSLVFHLVISLRSLLTLAVLRCCSTQFPPCEGDASPSPPWAQGWLGLLNEVGPQVSPPCCIAAVGLDTRAWMLKEYLRRKYITLSLHEPWYPSQPHVLLLRSDCRLIEEGTCFPSVRSDHNIGALSYLGCQVLLSSYKWAVWALKTGDVFGFPREFRKIIQFSNLGAEPKTLIKIKSCPNQCVSFNIIENFTPSSQVYFLQGKKK